MKKITSILCAVLVALSISAQVLPVKEIKSLNLERALKTSNNQFKAPAADVDYVIGTVNVIDTYLSYGFIIYGFIDVDMTRGFYFAVNVANGESDVELGKTYAIADMYANNCFTYTTQMDKTKFTSASFTKSLLEDGRVKIVASGTVAAGTTYNLTYEEPKVVPPTGETINVVINEPFNRQYYASSKDWYITAEDDNYLVVIDFFSDNAESPVGSYNSADEQFDLSYTSVTIKGAEENTKIQAVEAKATISEEGSLLKLEAFILGNDGNVYAVQASCNPSVLQYDTDADFAHDFDGYELDDTYFEEEGELDIQVFGNDYQLLIALFSATKELTAGEYPINDSGLSGTVMASKGYESGVGVYPSYVATIAGEFLDELWYFVSGTVTVKDDLAIEIAALNSYGKSINIKLAAPKPTAVEAANAEVKAVKRVVNGQVVIEKNGVRYNLLGTEIK